MRVKINDGYSAGILHDKLMSVGAKLVLKTCVMQPVGKDNIIIYEGGFKKKNELEKLIEIFGENSIIKISKEEQYDGCSNLFSINEKTIISDSTFTRLNKILTSKGIKVEKVYYREISKYGGLFRCSTLPLNRI